MPYAGRGLCELVGVEPIREPLPRALRGRVAASVFGHRFHLVGKNRLGRVHARTDLFSAAAVESLHSQQLYK